MNVLLAVITAPTLTFLLFVEPWPTLAALAILAVILAGAIWLADKAG